MTMYMILVVIAGAVLSIQVGINYLLRTSLGNPIVATFASFIVGAVCLLIYALLIRAPWPSFAVISKVPAWHWIGGALGAFYVAATIIAAPKLGMASLISIIVASQLLTSLVLDHYGLFGFAQHSINLSRLLGGALLIAGVLLIVRN